MQCHNTNAHIIDSEVFGSGFALDEFKNLFSDKAKLQRWMDVEVALAKSQADLNIIPKIAAEYIGKHSELRKLDFDYIKEEIKLTGHSLVPLLKAWQRVLPKEYAHYLHYGATTQDIQDTAQSLEIKICCQILLKLINETLKKLLYFTKIYKNEAIIGRTHGQQALLTTLGLKFSVWLDELLRHAKRLKLFMETNLVTQLFGGVGTMSALGSNAIELQNQFATYLGLSAPLCAWHVSRDRFAEFSGILALLTGTYGKIANEILQLSKNEIGEFREGFSKEDIGSSTMPHKHNHEKCERVVLLSKLVKCSAFISLDGLINEHERDYRSMRAEWVVLSESTNYTGCAIKMMNEILSNIEICSENISRNIKNSIYSLSSEKILFFLSKYTNKSNAYKIVYDIFKDYKHYVDNSDIFNTIKEHPLVDFDINRKDFDLIFEYEQHIGSSDIIIDNVISEVNNFLSKT